ncbi:MAG: glutaredoxin 2 [Bdellovibrionales bacterium]|nr:glutaredoxin 2 [Bdellovibrionales bacterium]
MSALYHFPHCPYCIRVRLALGYLDIPYVSNVISYDDEATPTDLIGKKMLPIWEDSDGAMCESLDIILKLDSENQLATKDFYASADRKGFEDYLDQLGKPIHSLAWPVWIYTKEFSASARDYVLKKKEPKRGPFKNLVARKEDFLKDLAPLLHKLEQELIPFYQSSNLTIKDILLAAHLWGLYVVPEFQFSESIHKYLQKIKKQCLFNYTDELWL